jgi:hypothetical protein
VLTAAAAASWKWCNKAKDKNALARTHKYITHRATACRETFLLEESSAGLLQKLASA